MKAAIYCRLSCDDGHLAPSENSESIYNQQILLKAYADKHNYDIFAVYTDDNYSGLDKNRPAFRQLINDARSGCFEVILCKDQSRFTRDLKQSEYYLNYLFPLWNIRFIGINDQTDSSSKASHKILQLNGLINEWYCEDLSENIKSVLHDKMLNGQFIGSFSCYGYSKSPSSHQMLPDPYASGIVRKIFELYTSNHSLQKIADILNRNGILPPAVYKCRLGIPYKTPFSAAASKHIWYPSSIRRILTNPVYTGTLIQGKEIKESCKSSRRIKLDKSKWHIICNAHQPLISTQTFECVQKLLNSKRKSKK